MNRNPARQALLFCAIALLSAADRASAAHLYAAANGGINVYDIAGNGTLALRQTVPVGPGFFMAVTPGGRFLYAAYGSGKGQGIINIYAAQSDGTIRQQIAPFVQAFRGWRDIAMHPSGDYLYLVDLYSEAVQAYSTGDTDGHLTPIGSFNLGAEAEHVAVDPQGEFVFGGQHYQCPGHVTTARVEAQGALTVVGRFGIPSVTGLMSSDGRFVYVQGGSDSCSADGLEIFSILRIEPDGSISTVRTYKEKTGPMLPLDRYLAIGKGQDLFVYAIDRMGNRTQTDDKPIQTFALEKGRNCWASTVWVATDDGIVTYSFDAQTGKLNRIGKVMVSGATSLAFGTR